MTQEKVWFEDLRGFIFNQEGWLKFIPDKNYTFIENLNSALRFSIILAILVSFIKRDYKALYFVAVTAFGTYLLYTNNAKQEVSKIELFEKLNITNGHDKKSMCYKPSKDNPFMNVTMGDMNDFPNRPPACDITRATTKEKIKDLFDHGLYRDIDDIYHKKASDRQFYTTPSTTIPNDQVSFAQWCFKTGKTLKEANM
jgi:hypothetical protein